MSKISTIAFFILMNIIGCGTIPFKAEIVNKDSNISKRSVFIFTIDEVLIDVRDKLHLSEEKTTFQLYKTLFYTSFFHFKEYDPQSDTFFAIEYKLTIDDKYHHYSTTLPIVITCDNNFTYEYNYIKSPDGELRDKVIVYLSKEFLEAKGCLHVDNQPSSLQTQYLGDRDISTTDKIYHFESNIITITSQELQQQEQ